MALLGAMLFGAAAPLSKSLLGVLSNFHLAGLLYLGAALGVSLILIREGTFRLPWKIPRRNSLRLLGAIVFGGMLGPIFLLAGLRIAAAASVSLWLNMEMAATVVIGYFFFNDHLSKKGWLASLGILTGTVLLAWGGGVAGFKAGGFVALACICWGIDNHLTALIDGISPAQSTFWKGLTAGSINLILGMLVAPIPFSSEIIFSALALGAVSYGLSILLYITAAQHLGATRSQLIFSSAPFFGLLISLFLGEALSLLQGSAFILFLGSVFVLFRESHGHNHLHESFTHLHMHVHPDEHHQHEHPEGVAAIQRHSHEHAHNTIEHNHPHWPDLHHRHGHSR